MKINLQKFIASAGICSRRKAADLIEQGKVMVNGKPAELGMRVDENDKVEVDGFKTPLSPLCERGGLKDGKIYIKLNKPVGYTCTNKKFKGEKNVFELVEKHTPYPSQEGNYDRLFIVGRLDKDSRGLVLLTNDGDMAQRLTHPSFGHEKRYEVRISGIKNQELRIMNGGNGREIKKFRNLEIGELEKFKKAEIRNEEIEKVIKYFKSGVEIGDCEVGKKISEKLDNTRQGKIPPNPPLRKGGIIEIVRAKEVKYLGKNKFLVILTTGKKRQIRRMFSALGYEVTDLLRTAIGKLELGNLREGEWKYVKL
ncbi:MAG: pseudouridine synthase [bacterium]